MTELRVAFVAEGNAESTDCWSGCAMNFVRALRARGVIVEVINAELSSWRRMWTAACTLRPGQARWRAEYRFGSLGFRMRSATAEAAIRQTRNRYDFVIQAGATFLLRSRALAGAPLIVYADSNVRFAERGRPFSAISHLDASAAAAVARRESRVYGAAQRIWSWSRALAESFQTDFGQPKFKIAVLYAGANLDAGRMPSGERGSGPPTILFVGKQFRRKGSDILLEAFGHVRERVPMAELHIVGAVPPGSSAPGIVAHGFLRGDTPEGRRRLEMLYRRATVFCMPSRYEPFGVSFVEAMLAGLPCIGTRSWAMPEIIVEGDTGWLVPDGDTAALTQALLAALTDVPRSIAMGQAGRARALDLFTWDAVADRAMADLDGMRPSSTATVGADAP